MNPEIKKQWIAALLSGEYEQGKLRLKTLDDTYCCLGVLCDLHSKATNIPWDGRKYRGRVCDLPAEVLDWSNLEKGNSLARYWQNRLTCLNDSGESFDEIAKFIEEKL